MQRKYILQAESLINDFHFGWKSHPKVNHAPPMPKHGKPIAIGYFSGSKTTIASSKCPKTEASLIKKIFHLPSLDIALNNTSQQVKNMTFPKHAYFSSLFWSYFYDFFSFAVVTRGHQFYTSPESVKWLFLTEWSESNLCLLRPSACSDRFAV